MLPSWNMRSSRWIQKPFWQIHSLNYFPLLSGIPAFIVSLLNQLMSKKIARLTKSLMDFSGYFVYVYVYMYACIYNIYIFTVRQFLKRHYLYITKYITSFFLAFKFLYMALGSIIALHMCINRCCPFFVHWGNSLEMTVYCNMHYKLAKVRTLHYLEFMFLFLV